MTKPWRWLIPLLVLAVLAWGASRWWRARQAGLPAAAASASAPAAPRLELAPSDILSARPLELVRGVAITGQIKAVQSAVLKAKVAGELQSLAVREGDAVRAGQVLGQIDPTEFDWKLRQAQQQADASQAQLEVAERTLANNRALVAQGFISPTALDTSMANANGARATWQAAQAAVELARKARADATLIAPIGGLVSQRLAQPGERLALDGRVLEIVDLSRLELEAAVPPQEVPLLSLGAAAQLHVDGLAEPLAARLVRLNPSATAGARTVTAYLSVPPQPALRQGLFARGQLAAGRQTSLAVPTSAIRIDQPQPYVLLLAGDRVVHRTVQTGAQGQVDGQAMTAISAGLREGDRLLSAQAGLVRDGTLVRLAGAGAVGAAAPVAGASGAAASSPTPPGTAAAASR